MRNAVVLPFLLINVINFLTEGAPKSETARGPKEG
jgi:hypothetical protein